MKPIEFPVILQDPSKIDIPQQYLHLFEVNQPLMVIILVPNGQDEKAIFLQLSKNDHETTAPNVKKRGFGSMKGLITYMADDFDEPLEDFKEYM